jgi:hypothetical protein
MEHLIAASRVTMTQSSIARNKSARGPSGLLCENSNGVAAMQCDPAPRVVQHLGNDLVDQIDGGVQHVKDVHWPYTTPLEPLIFLLSGVRSSLQTIESDSAIRSNPPTRLCFVLQIQSTSAVAVHG